MHMPHLRVGPSSCCTASGARSRSTAARAARARRLCEKQATSSARTAPSRLGQCQKMPGVGQLDRRGEADRPKGPCFPHSTAPMNESGSSGLFSRRSVTQSFMYAVTPHRSRYSSASSEPASAVVGACRARAARHMPGGILALARARRHALATSFTVCTNSKRSFRWKQTSS